MESPQISGILKELSQTMTALTMIAFMGYDGYFGLQHAAKVIPKSFNSYRKGCICRTLNYYVPSDCPESQFQEDTVENLLEIIDHQQPFTNNIGDALIKLTEETGEVFTMFLSPPVLTCINPSCRISGHMNSLSPNHAPVDVVVFDVDGPTLASKISLKCKCCNTIYNYNKYGKKKKDGECFYEVERELVEVTDVVYVTTRMYSLYTSFW